MRVLFLDIDDVLVVPRLHKIKNRRRCHDGRKVHYAFLPAARTCLLSIVSACPEVRIVISSTWRLEGRREVETILRLNACGQLIERLHDDWRTCDEKPGWNRADEIAEWLFRHPEVECAAAIDNDPAVSGHGWAIAIDPAVGLSQACAAAAIALLQARSSDQAATDVRPTHLPAVAG